MNSDQLAPPERNDALYAVAFLRAVFLFVVVCAAIFLLLFDYSSFFRPHRYILKEIFGLGHIPLFGLIAWSFLLVMNSKIPGISNWRIRSYLAAFVFTLVLSFLSELLQIMTSRDASVGDFFLNNLGGALFLVGGLLWKNQEFSGRSGRWYRQFRVIFVVASVIMLAFVARPLVSLTIDEMQLKASFPIIASFETEREVKRWNGGDNELALSREYVDDGKYSLKVTLFPSKYSGISLIRLPSDWRVFHSFDFTIFNPSNKELTIILKISDWDHDYNYDDRFNKLLHISPGKDFFSIPLREIESSPARRKMRMDRIGQISLFMRDLKQEQVLYFDNIRLAKDM